jgi:hypothetical protein
MKRNYRLHNAERLKEKQAAIRRTEKYQLHMGEYRRKWAFAKRYGITIEEFDRLYEACEGKCQICRKPLNREWRSKYMACVDHDHETRRVRGILCRRCNQALGAFGDLIEGLQIAIDYLRRSEASTTFMGDDAAKEKSESAVKDRIKRIVEESA